MFSRYGVNYLVQLHDVQARASRPASEESARPVASAAEEIAIFVRLGGVIAAVAIIAALVVWASH